MLIIASPTPTPITRLLWRGDSVWREDYNKNQPRDSRGRWSSGGGGGGKKSGGGGGGLASKKVAELQEIAKAEGIDPDTLSHKRRKSVLAAAIEAKRKGKNLREAGLLKPTKTKGGLRGQSKKKSKKKPEPKGTHEDFSLDSLFKRREQLMERLKTNEDEAKAIDKALRSWTASGFENVKEYQRGGKDKKGEEITKHLDKILYSDEISPYKGAIYRGMTFRSEEDRNNFVEKAKKEGVKLKNHSSFSSSGKIAASFASSTFTEREDSPAAIIRVVSNKTGKSIKAFSILQEEDEILVPIGTKYRSNGNYQQKKMPSGKVIDIIDVEEID